MVYGLGKAVTTCSPEPCIEAIFIMGLIGGIGPGGIPLVINGEGFIGGRTIAG